ncbi:helix-turn-helix domain-containing protein [Saccharopolyspora sp. NPDC002376]
MPNDRLRDAIAAKGITPDRLAEELGTDPKTVERWITTGRTPYPRYRRATAAVLGEREHYLWPEAATDAQRNQASESEIIKVFPHRSAVPADLWDRLLAAATTHVDILVYVGMFLTEKPNLLATLKEKAGAGAQVRLLFGDRDSEAVIQRSLDERIGRNTISAKIDHALAYFEPMASIDGVEVRTHGTVLYNSIFRFDDDMIVNPHVYGKVASHAPALHLRQLSAGNMFTTYLDSLDAIWESATPYTW